jgi:hypothetical protein
VSSGEAVVGELFRECCDALGRAAVGHPVGPVRFRAAETVGSPKHDAGLSGGHITSSLRGDPDVY